MKRFYTAAAAGPIAGGHTVFLDGKPVKTPARNALCLPTEALAGAIAAEWAAQGDTIEPRKMRLMGMACTVLDRIPERRGAAIDQVLAFAETDLLCYRATDPAELVTRQAQAWQPLLDWAAERFDAVLRTTSGVMPLVQPREAIQALRRAVEAVDDWRLSALLAATSGTGSLVVGLALVHGRLDAAGAWRVARIDSDFQEERWGRDELSAESAQHARADLDAAEAWLRLLG
ncbi:MAG: ATPase [Alphaproteobacteria bacterium]|nr:ATPase [Alphaproteobacteria bacterium]